MDPLQAAPTMSCTMLALVRAEKVNGCATNSSGMPPVSLLATVSVLPVPGGADIHVRIGGGCQA